MTTKPKNQPQMTKRFWIGQLGAFGLWATVGLIFLGPAAPRSEATDRTWISNFGYWMTAANWQGDVAPAAGDNLFFSAGSLSIYSTNDYPSGTMFGQINIGTSRFAGCTLAGLPITLTNGIALTGISLALAAAVDCNITLDNDQTFSATRVLNIAGNVDVNSHQLTVNNSGSVNFSGSVSNSIAYEPQLVIKTNTGTMVISSSAQFSSAVSVSVEEGSLVLDGVENGDAYGGTISGTGMAYELEVGGGGTLSPGDNVPGILRCNYVDLSGLLSPGGTLQITINGTTPGTNYSQLVVYTNYFLTYEALYTSAGLNVQLGYAAQIGDSFLIIKQMSGVPYQLATDGMFYELPPNNIYDTTNGYSLAVLYDTNGVTLTTVRTPTSPFVLWKG